MCHSRSRKRLIFHSELAAIDRRIAEIRQKYTRPDQQEYLRLLIAAWLHHRKIVESQMTHDD